LQRDPENTIALARRNLSRMLAQHPRSRVYLEKWSEILSLSADRIADVLCSPSQDARDLRSCSPFAGALTESQRLVELKAFREHWLESR